MVATTIEIAWGVRMTLVAVTLRLARSPAYRAGWVEVYDFLESGYRAFRPMRDVEPFARAIRKREINILERI